MFLVDGYNAIRRTPSLSSAETRGGLAAGRRALVATLVASGILRSSRVMVVFDAGEAAGGVPEASPHRMLSVRYSIPPQDADAAILALIENAKEKGRAAGLTLVTADRDLSFRARLLGAGVVPPEEWDPLRAKRIRGARPRPRGSSTSESSNKPRATAADVDYWLTVFGEDDEE
jgi:YacP-like NYN domain